MRLIFLQIFWVQINLVEGEMSGVLWNFAVSLSFLNNSWVPINICCLGEHTLCVLGILPSFFINVVS